MPENQAVIDASNAPVGRLSSVVAKRLLKGERIIIINAGRAVITGDPLVTVNKYLARRSRGTPQHGPFFPTGTAAIMQRAVRGMLPYKKPSGREALRRLQIHENNAGMSGETFAKEVRTRFITLKELSRQIGGKGD